jgi:hypothetical protein
MTSEAYERNSATAESPRPRARSRARTVASRRDIDFVTDNVSHKKGRPRIGAEPMSTRDRKRRSRAKRKKAWDDLSSELRFRYELFSFMQRHLCFRRNQILTDQLQKALKSCSRTVYLAAMEEYLDSEKAEMMSTKEIYGPGLDVSPWNLWLMGKDDKTTFRTLYRQLDVEDAVKKAKARKKKLSLFDETKETVTVRHKPVPVEQEQEIEVKM